jgi:hypothetical protein
MHINIRAHGSGGVAAFEPKVRTTSYFVLKGGVVRVVSCRVVSCPMNTAGGWRLATGPPPACYTPVYVREAVPRGIRTGKPGQPTNQTPRRYDQRGREEPCLPYPDYKSHGMQDHPMVGACLGDGDVRPAGLGWVKRAMSLPVLGTDLGEWMDGRGRGGKGERARA